MVVHSGLYIPVSSSIHHSLLDLLIISPVLVLTLTHELWFAGRVYLVFGCVGSLSLQIYWTYHRLLHVRVAVNSNALPVYKKNRIASLLCIFKTITTPTPLSIWTTEAPSKMATLTPSPKSYTGRPNASKPVSSFTTDMIHIRHPPQNI